MRNGSCLCGKFNFEYKNTPFKFTLCHCEMCRKFSGAPFGAFVGIERSNYKVTKGKEFEKENVSSEWASRTFCSNCGSSLRYIYNDTPDHIYMSAGVINGDVGTFPDKHIFYKDKCLWYTPGDDLQKIERF